MRICIPRVPRAGGVLVLALALGCAVSAESGAAVTDSPTIYVNYAMNCTFRISNDAGSPVTTLAPGDYQVEVTTPTEFAGVDLSGINDMTACKGSVLFQLTGPGVSLADTLDDGDSDYVLLSAIFKPSSTYIAQDNNQPTVAHVIFTTLASGTPTSPTTTPTQTTTVPVPSPTLSNSPTVPASSPLHSSSAPMRGRLIATVSAAGALSLTNDGKAVASLTAGKYTFSVNDRSTRSGFILQEIGKAATTVARTAFVGKLTETLDLKAGQWFFYPTAAGKKSYFIVTT